jgi:hypothetical protein
MEAIIVGYYYWLVPLAGLGLFAVAYLFPRESDARAILRFAAVPLVVYSIAFVPLIATARDLWDLRLIAFSMWLIPLLSVGLFVASRFQPRESDFRGGLILFAWLCIVGSPLITFMMMMAIGMGGWDR